MDNRFYKSMRHRLCQAFRLRILCIATLAILSGGAAAQALSSAASAPVGAASAPPGLQLRSSASLQPPPRGDAAKQLPIVLRARELRGRPDLDAEAEGDVEFRRGAVVIRSDRLSYDQAEDLARATGNVVVSRDGNVFFGPELQLRVERFEGFFRSPTYRFARTDAGGKATRIEFIDDQRAVAIDATYSSCSPEDPDPPWILKADRIDTDNETSTGIARNAVLRFYGVPILASPVLSFPLNDERRSGFLPPSFGLDSRSGLQFGIPYYWNIAPNRDATFTLSESLRRGAALESEFRYLQPAYFGEANFKLLPNDRAYDGHSRYAMRFNHEGALPYGVFAQAKLLRVSDDDYWKDFPGDTKSPTPRLLQSDLQLSRPFGDWLSYGRVQRWQVLQTADPTTRIEPPPYERVPQIGARFAGPLRGGFEAGFESEFNRFANPDDHYLGSRLTGDRIHALGSISRPFYSPGWNLVPKISFNAATYSLDQPLADGRRSASRVIPSVSIDSAWALERDVKLFGRAFRETLEPRLFYVNTPYRRQADLPNFDSAPKDFNADSIFTENAFSGVDRVSDVHQVTAGITSRLVDPQTGVEALRLGVMQRYLFRDQRVTPDGPPLTQRFSDILVLGSTSLLPNWTFDAQFQYNPDTSRIVRSIAGFRFSPGPYRTVNLNYRLSRGLSEQVEVGWQWPVYGRPRAGASASGSAGGASCSGTLYSVGRANYSTRDSRLTDAIAGFEYDAGCWIGRVVVERLSTGRSEATTRLLVQLELVGLSRIGSNPLRVLKDNVPGYQLLRDERSTSSPFTPYD
ncbi:MAG: LPS assembly protein LptD [Caldimonas sp.]